MLRDARDIALTQASHAVDGHSFLCRNPRRRCAQSIVDVYDAPGQRRDEPYHHTHGVEYLRGIRRRQVLPLLNSQVITYNYDVDYLVPKRKCTHDSNDPRQNTPSSLQ